MPTTMVESENTGQKYNLDGYAKAVLNILEDASAEKLLLQETQKAVLNILEDSDAEKLHLEQMQMAVINILSDLAAEVDDRKRFEQTLLEANEIQSRHLAELAAVNTELEQFAYVASHDLQEPLRMVASYTQLLAERYQGRLDEKADKYIRYAVDGATRMQGLISDLLTLSRVGKDSKPFEDVDCQALLANVVQSVGKAIEESEAEIVVGDMPTVLGDRTQLGQLFQNLIENAIKFRGDRKPRVEVSASRATAGWTFDVHDNGIGIAAEFHDRIFVIFQRLHSRAEYKGTGIGLALVKKIVERHRGRVWLESAPGVGTHFLFTISDASA